MSEKENPVLLLPLEDPALLRRLNETYGVNAKRGLLYIEKREIKSTLLYSLQKPHAQILSVSSADPAVFAALVQAAIDECRAQGMTDVRFGAAVSSELLGTLALGEEVRPRTFVI